MSECLRLRTGSIELLPDAIRTLPVKPTGVNHLDFVVRDIPDHMIHQFAYKDVETDELRHYLEECERQNIIPFSVLNFRYNSSSRRFYERKMETIVPVEDSNGTINQAIIGNFIKGGRIHKLKFKIEPPVGGGFDIFREQYLERLVDSGYDVDYGDIWLSHSGPGSGYSDSYDVSGRLDLHSDESGYSLSLNEDFSEDSGLVEWFNGLKEKYETSSVDA